MIDEENPTDEERAAIERAWYAGEPLPPGWVVVELPVGAAPNPKGGRTFVILSESWIARGYAGQLGDDN